MVYTKRRLLIQFPQCPYCKRARELLAQEQVPYEILNIDPNDRSLVLLLSGQPSVPILVEVVGGQQQDDDIEAYIRGELKN